VLGHHAAVGVGDLDAVVADGVVGGGDDDPDGSTGELDGAERGQDAGAADGGRHGGAVSAESRRAIGEPAACAPDPISFSQPRGLVALLRQQKEAARTAWEREAGRDVEEAAALLLLLVGGHAVPLRFLPGRYESLARI